MLHSNILIDNSLTVCFCACFSYDRGSTYNVFVGKKQLIEGMDKALVGMCVNERRLVKIPPQLAYGKQGYGAYVWMCAKLISAHCCPIWLIVWNENKTSVPKLWDVRAQTGVYPSVVTINISLAKLIITKRDLGGIFAGAQGGEVTVFDECSDFCSVEVSGSKEEVGCS